MFCHIGNLHTDCKSVRPNYMSNHHLPLPARALDENLSEFVSCLVREQEGEWIWLLLWRAHGIEIPQSRRNPSSHAKFSSRESDLAVNGTSSFPPVHKIDVNLSHVLEGQRYIHVKWTASKIPHAITSELCLIFDIAKTIWIREREHHTAPLLLKLDNQQMMRLKEKNMTADKGETNQ